MAPSHYLNQWWLIYWRIYASLGLKWVKQDSCCDKLFVFEFLCIWISIHKDAVFLTTKYAAETWVSVWMCWKVWPMVPTHCSGAVNIKEKGCFLCGHCCLMLLSELLQRHLFEGKTTGKMSHVWPSKTRQMFSLTNVCILPCFARTFQPQVYKYSARFHLNVLSY